MDRRNSDSCFIRPVIRSYVFSFSLFNGSLFKMTTQYKQYIHKRSPVEAIQYTKENQKLILQLTKGKLQNENGDILYSSGDWSFLMSFGDFIIKPEDKRRKRPDFYSEREFLEKYEPCSE